MGTSSSAPFIPLSYLFTIINALDKWTQITAWGPWHLYLFFTIIRRRMCRKRWRQCQARILPSNRTFNPQKSKPRNDLMGKWTANENFPIQLKRREKFELLFARYDVKYNFRIVNKCNTDNRRNFFEHGVLLYWTCTAKENLTIGVAYLISRLQNFQNFCFWTSHFIWTCEGIPEESANSDLVFLLETNGTKRRSTWFKWLQCEGETADFITERSWPTIIGF